MQGIELATIFSGRPLLFNLSAKKTLGRSLVFLGFSSKWSRDTVEMQGFELAAISVPPSDFHNFFEVATGHRRNAGDRAGGSFLSSLFSVLSFLCSVIAPSLCARLAEQDPCIFAGDYEASRPPTL